MGLDYISSKTLNYPYITGKKAILKIKDSDEHIRALVFYVDDKKIGLSVANNALFKRGVTCFIEVLYKANLLRLECVIKKFEDGILYMDMPRQATIIQQREDLRVDCNIKCTIEHFTTGRIKNISAGGVFIDLDTPLDISIFDKDKFKVCFSLNNVDLRLNGSAIEITNKYIRVAFVDINEEFKEFITLYCCGKDSEMFRRYRNAR